MLNIFYLIIFRSVRQMNNMTISVIQQSVWVYGDCFQFLKMKHVQTYTGVLICMNYC